MPEGLGPAEVAKEIAEHRERAKEEAEEEAREEKHRHDRRVSIIEAVLLSLVAVLAAYSGYAVAKWGTESSIQLAKAPAQRTRASRFTTSASAFLLATENDPNAPPGPSYMRQYVIPAAAASTA